MKKTNGKKLEYYQNEKIYKFSQVGNEIKKNYVNIQKCKSLASK